MRKVNVLTASLVTASIMLSGCSKYVEKPIGTYQTEPVIFEGPSGQLSGNPVADDMQLGVEFDDDVQISETVQHSIDLIDNLRNKQDAYIRMDAIKSDGTVIPYVLKYKDNYSYVAYNDRKIVSNTENSYLMYNGKEVAYKAAIGTFSFTSWKDFCTMLQFDIEDYTTSGKKVVGGVSVNYNTFGNERIYITDSGELYGVSYKDREIVFTKIATTDNLDDFKIPSEYSILEYTK